MADYISKYAGADYDSAVDWVKNDSKKKASVVDIRYYNERGSILPNADVYIFTSFILGDIRCYTHYCDINHANAGSTDPYETGLYRIFCVSHSGSSDSKGVAIYAYKAVADANGNPAFQCVATFSPRDNAPSWMLELFNEELRDNVNTLKNQLVGDISLYKHGDTNIPDLGNFANVDSLNAELDKLCGSSSANQKFTSSTKSCQCDIPLGEFYARRNGANLVFVNIARGYSSGIWSQFAIGCSIRNDGKISTGSRIAKRECNNWTWGAWTYLDSVDCYTKSEIDKKMIVPSYLSFENNVLYMKMDDFNPSTDTIVLYRRMRRHVSSKDGGSEYNRFRKYGWYKSTLLSGFNATKMTSGVFKDFWKITLTYTKDNGTSVTTSLPEYEMYRHNSSNPDKRLSLAHNHALVVERNGRTITEKMTFRLVNYDGYYNLSSWQ